jgi:hypothetical protein
VGGCQQRRRRKEEIERIGIEKSQTQGQEILHHGSIRDEAMGFQRTGCYDLMYMKTRELGCKGSHGIQSIGLKTL